MRTREVVLASLLVAIFAASAAAQHDHGRPSGVEKRGDAVMGFDHDKTTHHFFITNNGGSIQVTANNTSDKESIVAIRSHLPHVAKMFTAGDFTAPILVHDKIPPGSKVMAAKKELINYSYADIDRGGKIVIATSDTEAIKAVHEFLRMQINEHKTGDSVK